jgi:hypothetical protein
VQKPLGHYKLAGRINHHGYLVLLFKNRWHDPQVSLSRSSAGSFCTYVGTLFYRGQTGKDATSALLSDLSNANSNCLTSILGNYCLIIGDADGIRVITDRAGLHHTYFTADLSLICNSFIGATQYLTNRSFLEHEVLEYILYGATFGTQTLVRDILLLDPQFEIRLNRAQRSLKDRDSVWESIPEANSRMGIEEQLNTAIQMADDYYGQVGASFGSNVTAALSGGHDSRLNLAFLRRHEICPRLFVYGASDDPDVLIAKSICVGEGLALEHIDRGNSKPLDPDAYWSNQEDVFHGVDGLTQYGFACDPDEISQRRQRVDGGLLAINGGGGEIWRDYWKLPDKPALGPVLVPLRTGLPPSPRSVCPDDFG